MFLLIVIAAVCVVAAFCAGRLIGYEEGYTANWHWYRAKLSEVGQEMAKAKIERRQAEIFASNKPAARGGEGVEGG